MRPNIPTRAAIGLGAVALGVGLSSCSLEPTPPTSGPAIPAPTAPTPSSQNEVPAPSSEAATTTVYTDGEYSATGWYGGLPSHQDVTITVDDDVVTAVEITTPAEDETSLGYQQRFAEALPAAVVGRSLDEISFDRLAGSSGCSEGFMDALAQIKEQATA